MHDFCRTLHTLRMADVREHTTAAQRKATWAYKFTVGQGRRPTFEWNGPDGYRWEGTADCLWDAKFKGWGSWMEKVITPPICEHDGENCQGSEHCNNCQVQIFSGYKDADERYCNDHKPATWDAEIAEMTEEDFDDQDEMYWTEWEIDDIDCDCPAECPCRPTPEALQSLYDADRARSKAENDAINAKTYTVTQAQLNLIAKVLSDSPWDVMTLDEMKRKRDDVLEASAVVDLVLKQESPRPTENYYGQAIGYCELCEDERLEEDLNEDGHCPTCEERAEGS